MLRVAKQVTNTEYPRDAIKADGAVTSADIRQIKMNYLQHNKNQLPHNNGPVMPKTMEGGKTASQITL